MLPHEIPTYEKAEKHRKRCKICSMPQEVVSKVNGYLMRGKTLTFVRDYLEQNGCDVDPLQVSKHRAFLPFLIDQDQLAGVVSDCRAELFGEPTAEIVSEQAKVLADARMGYEYAKAICQMQMWGSTVPEMLARLSDELQSNKSIPIRDLAYALDLMVKNGNLLGGGATERLEFNGQVKSSDTSALGILLRTDPDAKESIAELYRRSARLQAAGEI